MRDRKAARWLAVACLLLLSPAIYYAGHSYLFCLSRSKSHSVQASSSRVATPSVPALRIDAVLLYGHIVEVEGSTDPGAVVMINGETAPTLFAGNTFRHFLGPLPFGTAIITITSQDERGGVNTQQVAATIE
jgi:hypothetical protein